MAENTEKLSDPKTAFDPLIQTENIAFAPSEMLTCDSCSRLIPPNRPKCLYCGNEIVSGIEFATGAIGEGRILEPWERGYNLVLCEKRGVIDMAQAARKLGLEEENIRAILDADSPLPIKRVESERAAATLKIALEEIGLKCTVVSDIDLNAQTFPRRLISVKISDGIIRLSEFNSGKTHKIEANELALVVIGVVSKSRIDSLEKRRRKSSSLSINESSTSSDEPVVDLYRHDDPIGFRIQPTGFDFSCLGAEMGLLASQNLATLIAKLKDFVPQANVIETYPSVRLALCSVWEVESRRDSLGMKRVGVGKSGFGSVTSADNIQQFTKFSRLQWHLL
ncbi:MAG: hypothetical protein ABIV48_10070 [Pyrinomonadaceae bacterium]